jgi:hypothetical protein
MNTPILDTLIKYSIKTFPDSPIDNSDRIFFIFTIICFIVLIVGIIALIIYIIKDTFNHIGVKPKIEKLIIIDKFHQGNTISTNVGMGVAVGGGVMPIVTSSGSGEEFELITKYNDNNKSDKIIRISISIEEFYKYNIGDIIEVDNYYERYTKELYKTELK